MKVFKLLVISNISKNDVRKDRNQAISSSLPVICKLSLLLMVVICLLILMVVTFWLVEISKCRRVFIVILALKKSRKMNSEYLLS